MKIFMFVVSLLIPLTMIGFGALWKKHPPADINMVYGYRTSMSMKNRQTWEFAHHLMGKIWFWTGIVVLALTLISFFVFYSSKRFETIMGNAVLIQIIPLCVGIIPVEAALHKKFDKDGRPKR